LKISYKISKEDINREAVYIEKFFGYTFFLKKCVFWLHFFSKKVYMEIDHNQTTFIKNIVFYFIHFLHQASWGFMLAGFLHPRTAYWNVYYFIPFVYIVHMLPEHPFNTIKTMLYPDDWRLRIDALTKNIPGDGIQGTARLFDQATFNPFSYQGIMIFGMITSAWRLKLL